MVHPLLKAFTLYHFSENIITEQPGVYLFWRLPEGNLLEIFVILKRWSPNWRSSIHPSTHFLSKGELHPRQVSSSSQKTIPAPYTEKYEDTFQRFILSVLYPLGSGYHATQKQTCLAAHQIIECEGENTWSQGGTQIYKPKWGFPRWRRGTLWQRSQGHADKYHCNNNVETHNTSSHWPTVMMKNELQRGKKNCQI